ncbi:unnamed protein product [Nezara viridula]|uniref:Neuropeptide n=1 Tax=Nezara viridula TaxID=85310 RepID=A0A9P0HQL0_NEZVI|nr:unnamed protein product [Nezara viridula]
MAIAVIHVRTGALMFYVWVFVDGHLTDAVPPSGTPVSAYLDEQQFDGVAGNDTMEDPCVALLQGILSLVVEMSSAKCQRTLFKR